MHGFTLDDSKIPRFTPTADFLCSFRFFYYNGTEIINNHKIKIFGRIKNLNYGVSKGGLNPSMFG